MLNEIIDEIADRSRACCWALNELPSLDSRRQAAGIIKSARLRWRQVVEDRESGDYKKDQCKRDGGAETNSFKAERA